MIAALLAKGLDRLRDRQRQRCWPPDRAAGRLGEDLAHRFLRAQGFIVVARNYRLASGDAEADLIAWEGDELAVIEVKTRASGDHGPPERAIDGEKERHMARVAREFTRKAGVPWPKVRCDVVTVVLSEPPRIELFRRAVRLRALG